MNNVDGISHRLRLRCSLMRPRWLTLGLFATISACVSKPGENGSQQIDSAATRADIAGAAKGAADSAVIRGPGVPTPADDTLGTRYGKHQGPARILSAPECQPAGFALCITDTASLAWTFRGDEGGMPDERRTQWLIFAAEQDSMQVFITRVPESYLWMSPASAAGFVAEHAVNDASWIRARFGHAGTYVFSARIPADSVVPYELRVAPVIATGASFPIGKSATLVIGGDSTGRVAIAPATMVQGLASDSAWGRFAVHPGTYRVLLVRDTTYVFCRLPCRNSQRFIVHPAQSVTIRP